MNKPTPQHLREAAAANAQAASAEATAAAALAAVGSGGNIPPATNSRQSDGANRRSGGSGVSRAIYSIAAAAALIAIALIVWLVWLTAGKASVDKVDAVNQTALDANRTATEAKADARSAAQLAEQADKHATQAQADASQAKADASSAVSTANDAKAQASKCAGTCPLKATATKKSVKQAPAHRSVAVEPKTPTVTGPCTNCVPVPSFQVEREESTVKTSKICGVAVLQKTGGSIIARLQLDEDPGNPGKMRIASATSFGGATTKVSVSPWKHSANKDCDEDQAMVYAHWPEVVAKFGLPNDCTHP